MAPILPFRRRRPGVVHREAPEQLDAHLRMMSRPYVESAQRSGLTPFWLRRTRRPVAEPTRGEPPYVREYARLVGVRAGFVPLMVPAHFRLDRLAALFAERGYRIESRAGIAHVVPAHGPGHEAA